MTWNSIVNSPGSDNRCGYFAVRFLCFVQSPPFVMRRQRQNSANGGRAGDLEGFCIDLLNELSRMLQLKFDIRLVNDSQHGTRDRQGNWNGLIRDILDMVSSDLPN